MNEDRKNAVDSLSIEVRASLFEYLLQLADDQVVLSHRLSEWCGHAPILEEDIALSNLALDGIGAAEALYQLAGEVEGEGRDENKLAYFRDATQFRNCQLVERPRGDFAVTMLRQYLFDTFALLQYEQLSDSSFAPLAALAGKFVKELRYHVRHSAGWLVRLGGGTEESSAKLTVALEELWRYTGELFEVDDHASVLLENGIAADLSLVKAAWDKHIKEVFEKSGLTVPTDVVMTPSARQGRHSEHLGHLLSEMQILPRSYPDAVWN